jgi:hypothetical protein
MANVQVPQGASMESQFKAATEGREMSGYGSKAEVTEVVKDTIASDWNKTGLSTNPRDYNISAIVRENFYNRGSGYGWGASMDAEEFVASLHRNLRRKR